MTTFRHLGAAALAVLCVALITGIVALATDIVAVEIAHKACGGLFVVLLVVLFVTKLRAKKA